MLPLLCQMQVLLSKKKGDQNHQNTDRGSKANSFTHTNTYAHTHTLAQTDRLNPDRRSIDKVFRESGVLKKEKYTGQTTREEGTTSLCPRTLSQCKRPLPLPAVNAATQKEEEEGGGQRRRREEEERELPGGGSHRGEAPSGGGTPRGVELQRLAQGVELPGGWNS